MACVYFQETFSSSIADILDTAKRYHVLSSFCEVSLSDSTLQMPFTIQAYGFALKDICQSFLQKIIEQENIVQRQGKS